MRRRETRLKRRRRIERPLEVLDAHVQRDAKSQDSLHRRVYYLPSDFESISVYSTYPCLFDLFASRLCLHLLPCSQWSAFSSHPPGDKTAREGEKKERDNLSHRRAIVAIGGRVSLILFFFFPFFPSPPPPTSASFLERLSSATFSSSGESGDSLALLR